DVPGKTGQSESAACRREVLSAGRTAVAGPRPLDSERGVLAGDYSYASISDKIADLVLERPLHRGWVVAIAIASGLLVLFVATIVYLVHEGVGIWGIDIPVAWGFALTNFVWWIGIGH